MSWYSAPSYDSGFEAKELKVVGCETFGDYQGDYVYVLESPTEGVGVVIVGYGSCSGCDSREACNSAEDFEELLQSVIKDIRWGTVSELTDFINNNFNDNSWYRHDAGFKKARQSVIKLIETGSND
jgi:hypothetical protein